jgi:hypothetical protein
VEYGSGKSLGSVSGIYGNYPEAASATVADRRTFSGAFGHLEGSVSNLGEALEKLEVTLSPILRPTPPQPTGAAGGNVVVSSASNITDATDALAQRVIRLHAKVIDLLQRVDL